MAWNPTNTEILSVRTLDFYIREGTITEDSVADIDAFSEVSAHVWGLMGRVSGPVRCGVFTGIPGRCVPAASGNPHPTIVNPQEGGGIKTPLVESHCFGPNLAAHIYAPKGAGL